MRRCRDSLSRSFAALAVLVSAAHCAAASPSLAPARPGLTAPTLIMTSPHAVPSPTVLLSEPTASVPVTVTVLPGSPPSSSSSPPTTLSNNNPAVPAVEGNLQTFLLPGPARPVANAFQTETQAAFHHVVGPHPVEQSKVNGEIVYSAIQGLEPIDITMAGNMDGTQYSSRLEPLDIFNSNALSSNSVLVSRAGEGVQLGGSSGDIPDTDGGIRLFKSIPGETGVAGVGLYQRLGANNVSLTPGVDSELQSSKDHSLDLALTADSSLRLTQDTLYHGWSTQTFVGWSALQKEGMDSLYLSKQFHSTALYQGVSLTSGLTRGVSWNEGLSQRFGQTDFLAQATDSTLNAALMQEFAVSMLRPIGRSILSMRWEDASQAQNGSSISTSEMISNVVVPLHNNSVIIIGDNIASETGESSEHQSMLSDAWEVNRIWDLQLGISHDWLSGNDRINGAVGFWATPQWEARMVFGPSETTQLGQVQSTVFGFQLVNRFDLTRYSSGTIDGQVLLDGSPSTIPIRMQMEDRMVTTDKNGEFRFDHATIGTHDVGFDIDALPATLSSATLDQEVTVEQGKTAHVVFSAQRVGTIQGSVIVDSDAFGNSDPTAGLGLVISDGNGHETTTNSDQSFALGSLPLGKTTITLLPSSLPPGYVVIGPGSFTIAVAADNTAAPLTFHIAPHKAVEITNLNN